MIFPSLKSVPTLNTPVVDTVTTGHINLQVEAELLGVDLSDTTLTQYVIVQATVNIPRVKLDNVSNTNLVGLNNIFVVPINNYRVFEWVNGDYLHYISTSGSLSVVLSFLNPGEYLKAKRFEG